MKEELSIHRWEMRIEKKSKSLYASKNIYISPRKFTSWQVKHGQRISPVSHTRSISRRRFHGGMLVVGTHRCGEGGGEWIRMRESSESVFWLSSAWTWFSSTQAKWRMVSTARASRLIQPSSFPRLTPFRCNVRYARRDDRDGEVEGKEEGNRSSVCSMV